MTQSRADAVALVDRYLELCEERALEAAAAMWAPGEMQIEFPDAHTYRSLGELVEASHGQYTWVRKHRDDYVVELGEPTTVVSMGRLYGVDLQGVPFGDVRYIDVFTVEGGSIRRQQVWNDLAVSGVLSLT